MKRKQEIESVRWDLALRYRLIETVAWWEGRLTTNHLMQSFGISRQQASKDINTYINEHAPKMRIPRSSGHPFHEHLTTDSTLIRPPIPRASGGH